MYTGSIHGTFALRYFVFALAIPRLLTAGTAFICGKQCKAVKRPCCKQPFGLKDEHYSRVRQPVRLG
jgi:hypothetical protein